MTSGRLLVLQDSPGFGGHEIMFLKLLPAAIDHGAFSEVVVRIPHMNRTLHDRLSAIRSPRLRVEPWDFAKRGGEPYFADFRRHYGAAVRDTLARERPRTVLLLQGRIENLAVPMLAMPRDQFVVSYIPMAHSMREMGRSGLIGDRVRRRLYRRPDRFVVPSQAVATQLSRAGARAPAVVVENVVDVPGAQGDLDLRTELRLPDAQRLALFLGRFDSGQKGLDLLVAAIERSASRLRGWTFLFVGDGPARASIEALGVDGHADVRIMPWTDTPHVFLRASDILLLPSRFEGVPLVMLEALSCGLPILASDLDVFREYLPAENRADFAKIDLAERMASLGVEARLAALLRAAQASSAEQRLARSRTLFAQALVAGESP